MTARSPRASAELNISWIAVLLPVPVVPINLKCLVSSCAGTARPASVISDRGRGGRVRVLGGGIFRYDRASLMGLVLEARSSRNTTRPPV